MKQIYSEDQLSIMLTQENLKLSEIVEISGELLEKNFQKNSYKMLICLTSRSLILLLYQEGNKARWAEYNFQKQFRKNFEDCENQITSILRLKAYNLWQNQVVEEATLACPSCKSNGPHKMHFPILDMVTGKINNNTCSNCGSEF